MKTYTIQFWAKYRGRQDVTVTPPPHPYMPWAAEDIAREAVAQAVRQFAARFTFPDYDRKEMRLTGISDGFETLHADGQREAGNVALAKQRDAP